MQGLQIKWCAVETLSNYLWVVRLLAHKDLMSEPHHKQDTIEIHVNLQYVSTCIATYIVVDRQLER